VALWVERARGQRLDRVDWADRPCVPHHTRRTDTSSMRDRGPTGIYAAGPGELLGWSPVLGRHAMTATAKVTAPCRLAVLDAARLNELIEQDRHFGVAFLRQLALSVSDRLSATRQCLAAAGAHGDLPRVSLLREGSD
jgi:CRP-like cAMP-binding protein